MGRVSQTKNHYHEPRNDTISYLTLLGPPNALPRYRMISRWWIYLIGLLKDSEDSHEESMLFYPTLVTYFCGTSESYETLTQLGTRYYFQNSRYNIILNSPITRNELLTWLKYFQIIRRVYILENMYLWTDLKSSIINIDT